MAKELPQTRSHTYYQTQIKATLAFAGVLKAHILDTIKRSGPISFQEYMSLALYHEPYGYYASGVQRVGKEGDFITSISIGACFGVVLARRIIAFWQQMGEPKSFHIIELGAHDGALCADVLTEIKVQEPALYAVIQYHLIETTEVLRIAQGEKLSHQHEDKFTSHSDLSALNGLTGTLLSNELLDAFPVELVTFKEGKWQQLFVSEREGELGFVAKDPIGRELLDFCQSLGTDFPEGYTTEYNPHVKDFTQQVSEALGKGLFITIDYGHEAQDLYHPQRTAGTLQTYHRHQKSDDPLLHPGEIDITSHVNFTQLIELAELVGFDKYSLTMQSSYLTQHGRDWLLSLENKVSEQNTSLLRQFQTLTHPSMLGTKFRVLEMEKVGK